MNTVPHLIEQFVPEHYQLSLTLERAERRFGGIVSLTGMLLPGATAIVLHHKELAIESVTLDGKAADFASSDNDELHITHRDLAPGKHLVVIAYSAAITDALHGLYPCFYDYKGAKKELLVTQFESHHAREVFPCVDEPAAKATFAVTLTTEPAITVLGNMPIKSQTVEGEKLVTSFETSPRMSTYLLAWVSGELHRKTATTNQGVEVNVWATPAQSPSSLDFALDIAVRSIEFYEQYFDTPYPLPKSDHVALPDFSSGAMENWGLVTYREIALLADTTTSIGSKQYIATVIAHELAHQWFGNLVTMKWWNNLWLNESFATLMEYIAVDALHPEWNSWLDFATNESIMALRRDSIDGVQSVQIDVNHPDEINSLFDGAIVYAKGARLLRMLQRYVGDAAFQAGLTQYFRDFAYGNTEADDLWQSIAQASGKDIVGLMNRWISQPGYPVVHVVQAGGTISLSQEQFFVGPHHPSTALWPIPLNSSEPAMPELLSTKGVSLPHHDDTLLRFNVGDSAHFITHYDKATLSRLVEGIAAGVMTPVDRVQLLDEATLLARGGMLQTVQLIDLIKAYRDETSEPVWTIIAVALAELRKFVEDDQAAEKKLRAFTADIAQAQYARLGWTALAGESEEDTKLRSTIIAMELYGENQAAIATAQSMFAASKLEELDRELRPLIIGATVRYGDGAIVSQLLTRYGQSQSGELSQDICAGITSTRQPDKIAELLEAIKNPAVIRPQDAARWFVYLIRSRDGRDQSWQWIRDNWQWIVTTFGGDKSYADYPRYSAGGLTSWTQLQEYIDFFTPLEDVPALSRVISMGISEIEGRVELIERDGPAVRAALLELASSDR
ncbi:MAG: M1 family metallopeptidase [Candidatus Saccharibacteria bacterium]